jgi:predicted RNase H-like nuclease (RuvC/YqgF family)
MSTIATITEPASTSSPTDPQPAKVSQLEQLLRQGKVFLQDLRAKLAAVTKERDQLVESLKERDASHEKLWAEQAELQRADTERHGRELEELRSQLKAFEGIRSELDEAVATRTRLADELRNADTQKTSLEKALATAVDDVEQLRADAERAAALAREIFEIHQK